MAPRDLIKEKIKQIITSLKEKPETWSDLKKVTSLPDKTLDRYLDYMEYWGLAQKSDAGWQWFENVRTYETEHDYELAINHSKKLLDTIAGLPVSIDHPELFRNRRTLPMKTRDALVLSDMAREHLKTGYPQIYAETVALEKLTDQRREMAESLKVYDPKIDKEKLPEYIINFNIKKYAIPKKHWKEVEKLVNTVGPERVAFIKETEKNYTENLIKNTNELRTLIFTVEHGEPLHGLCQLCPKIKIKQTH